MGTTTPKLIELPKPENTSYKVVKEISNKDVANIMSTKQYILESYKDNPTLIAIAYCESRYRQFDNEGNAIKSIKGSTATGVMQIMASIHEGDAEKLGMDIYTLEGNVRFAKYLYDKFGTKPWESSRDCWEPRLESLAIAR